MRKTQRINYHGFTRILPIDLDDKRVIDTFTTGQCHSLARAIHQLTDWPLCVMGYAKGGSIADAVYHVVCRAPDGRLVDVYGAWNQGEQWKNMAFVKLVSESTVRRLGWDVQDIRAAMPFAKRIVEKITKGEE